MREFRRSRIQREVSELLADVDTWNGGAGSPFELTLRQIGIAFLSLVIGVVLGQSVALTALKHEPLKTLQTARVESYGTPFATDGVNATSVAAYPDLPEIKLIYVPETALKKDGSGKSI